MGHQSPTVPGDLRMDRSLVQPSPSPHQHQRPRTRRLRTMRRCQRYGRLARWLGGRPFAKSDGVSRPKLPAAFTAWAKLSPSLINPANAGWDRGRFGHVLAGWPHRRLTRGPSSRGAARSGPATKSDIDPSGGIVAAKLPNGATLPFPPTPSASVAGRTLQESTYAQRVIPPRLHQDSPNIVIVLIDDVGPGLPTTFGGEVRTATMDRICAEGVSYNRFHTTAMCSPTRASLLTGRNHHEIGNWQISELSNDWDGYSGCIPRSSALVAEVLRDYGYSTAVFGKWHNTPAAETTAAGPFENWPTGLGFEDFCGFSGGGASHHQPNLVRNTTVVLPPKSPEQGYHLSEDLADDAIGWLHKHKAFQPDKPFYMYWASGAIHGPHHIMKDWADKYKGKFDDGWDAYRERVFKRAKEKGWIPANAQLTPRHETMQSWDSTPTTRR